MNAVLQFGRDVWDLSIDRIRRADPLLMGAAIAYNSLFALVPLAVAFVALLTFVDASGEVLGEVVDVIRDSALPTAMAAFLIDIMESSQEWVATRRGPLLVIATLIALWSGSRAVYAIQKALRTVEGVTDTRGYVVRRGLGILVTVASCVGVLIAYAALLLGDRLWDAVEARIGYVTADVAQGILATVVIVYVWMALWAIYRWGPPVPIERSGIVAVAVAVLLVLGSFLAFGVLPSFGAGSSTVAFLGAIGILLVWLYYIGVVVVAAPTVLGAFGGAIARRRRG